MHKALAQLYSGDFNHMLQEWKADGSVVVTLAKHGEERIVRLCVKNLYQEDEELLSFDEIVTSPPQHVLDRMHQARETNLT